MVFGNGNSYDLALLVREYICVLVVGRGGWKHPPLCMEGK